MIMLVKKKNISKTNAPIDVLPPPPPAGEGWGFDQDEINYLSPEVNRLAWFDKILCMV